MQQTYLLRQSRINEGLVRYTGGQTLTLGFGGSVVGGSSLPSPLCLGSVPITPSPPIPPAPERHQQQEEERNVSKLKDKKIENENQNISVV